MTNEEMVKEYQCSGCVNGPHPECFSKGDGEGCSKHCAGTNIYPSVGRIFLGLPTGFNRLGPCDEHMKITMFKSVDAGWAYDKFNIPVWKHLDTFGNTLVRGLSPRISCPWIHIFTGDVRGDVDCLELTSADLEDMD